MGGQGSAALNYHALFAGKVHTTNTLITANNATA